MGPKSLHYLRLAGFVLGLTLIISVIVFVLGYIYNWNEPIQFSNAFFASGGILIVLGVFSVTGGFAQRANFNMIYSESAGQANIAERNQRTMADITQRYGSMILLLSVGILLILIAVLIGKFLI